MSRILKDTLVLTQRNLIHYLRQPQLIVFTFVQPVLFVALFATVFGGAIDTPNGDYINYLLPGIFVQTVLFGGMGTGVGMAIDMQKGMIDRFRSLPMSRGAVLAGRTLADAIRNLFVILIMIAVGMLIGFRFQTDLDLILGSIGLLLAFGYVSSWIFAFVGVSVKDPETAQSAGAIWVFRLVFVPTETMGSVLRAFAENQPLSLLANVTRNMMLGGSLDDLGLVILWLVGIFAVFASLSIWQYNRYNR